MWHSRRNEVWDGGGQNHRDLRDGSPPAAGFRGGAPVGSLGTKFPEAGEFLGSTPER